MALILLHSFWFKSRKDLEERNETGWQKKDFWYATSQSKIMIRLRTDTSFPLQAFYLEQTLDDPIETRNDLGVHGYDGQTLQKLMQE